MPSQNTENTFHDRKPAAGLKLSIFTRLVTGYVIIFMLIVCVGIYINMQFSELKNVIGSLITVNNRISSYNKRIMDILLTIVTYEKKFIILKDESIFEQLMIAKGDFEQSLETLATSVDDKQLQLILDEIRGAYGQYEELLDKEVRMLKTGKSYRQHWYAMEKEKAVNKIIAGLKEIRTYNENSTGEKLIRLEEADARAYSIWLIATSLATIAGIILSVFITRSITRPLAVMRKKIRETAESNYQRNLQLSAPPEIDELIQDFNAMCYRLRETDRIKSDFFSFMSHELRTPITSVKEGVMLLLDGVGGEINEKQKRILQIISEESDRLIRLINSILDLSKMEAGKMQYHLGEADISALLSQAVTEMEPLTRAKNIKAEISVEDGLPYVSMDEEKILQVLRNLIGNAIKFTPEEGHITVAVKHSYRKLEVSISDEGPGIPEEHIHHIFDKFRSYGAMKGSGLGLALARSVINNHGGIIWAENNQGKGSTFTFVLPA
ncbi:MAG: ATP-binding protein [Thermodesulfovibrionales bacterium]|nr:ATP-binding protein [Thermodesulfovibrionales bacterium]